MRQTNRLRTASDSDPVLPVPQTPEPSPTCRHELDTVMTVSQSFEAHREPDGKRSMTAITLADHPNACAARTSRVPMISVSAVCRREDLATSSPPTPRSVPTRPPNDSAWGESGSTTCGPWDGSGPRTGARCWFGTSRAGAVDVPGFTTASVE
jgi:hypothetical protein